jgi:hypothetical protein
VISFAKQEPGKQGGFQAGIGNQIHGGQCPRYISSDLRRLQDKNGFRFPVIGFFLVPKLLLGNANFTPSSAWGHLGITHNLLILRDILCQAGAWQARWFPSGDWEPDSWWAVLTLHLL